MSGNTERITSFPYCSCDLEDKFNYWSMKLNNGNMGAAWLNSPENVLYETNLRHEEKKYPMVLMPRMYLNKTFKGFWLEISEIFCGSCFDKPTDKMVELMQIYMKMNWNKRGSR